MDEIDDKIEEALPNLSLDMVGKVREKLLSIGVMGTDDLKLVTEEDLSGILRPISARKFLLHIKEVMCPKTSSRHNNSMCSDVVSDVDSPQTSRCSTPVVSDTDTSSTEAAGTSSNGSKSNWVTNFSIPWNKFPKTLLDACSKMVRPRPSDRREMVRILCDHIQQSCKLPGRKALSRIAEMVTAKYSDSFCDNVGGTVVGSGYDSLRKQLEERIYNENRKAKRLSYVNQLNDTGEQDEEKPKRKRSLRDSYGCVNWQPSSLPDDESEESQKKKQVWLIEEFHKKNGDEKKVHKLMKETYVSQRLLINRSKPNPPSISEIEEEWPYLFKRDLMLQHFEHLMGFNLKDVLRESLEAKGQAIYDFMKQEQTTKKKVNETLLKINQEMDVENGKMPRIDGVYLLLLAYFNEPEDMMIKVFKETATEDDVTLDKNSIPATPFIATFGDILSCERCGLVVDQIMVNSSINGIGEGILMLFASYFILNIAYPNEIGATLEFIQRCLVKLNPDKGSKRIKTKGKHQVVNPKVLALVNALKDFQSQWVL